MRNLKHSIIALAAVTMVSSIAAAQADSFSNSKAEREQRINSAPMQESITIAQRSITDAITASAEVTTEEEAAEAAEPDESEIAAKSFYPLGYVLISSDMLNVRETPSDEAAVIDQLEVCTEVQVLESSEGWYKIAYDDKSGYVASGSITQDKSAALCAKMSFTSYKIGQISINGGSVRVRKEPSTEADIIEELDDGTYAYMLWTEGDFIRVAYGADCREGYIIDTALQFTGEWIEKSEISRIQREIAEAQAEKARAEEEARKKAAAAESNARKVSGGSSSASKQPSGGAPAASSKGQAIVNTAMQYLGTPYVWGGTSPSGFDCSGLVQYVCAKNGISVSRVAADQRNNGTYVSRNNLQPGDLVFFARGGYIHHVGIYIGNGNMIHAPQTGDVVKISSINTDYRVSSYAGAVRVY